MGLEWFQDDLMGQKIPNAPKKLDFFKILGLK
jgi:hypothetical protein